MAGSYWTNEETKALQRIWGAANVQAQLNVVSRKKVVYESRFLLVIMKYRRKNNTHTHTHTKQRRPSSSTAFLECVIIDSP